MPADPATTRLLESEVFRRCRAVADVIAGDPRALRALLAEVEEKFSACPELREEPRSVNIDIAAAMLEAHIEDLERGESLDRLEVAQVARVKLVTAGLHYLVLGRDAIPDWLEHGHLDDLVVMRWVVHVAHGGEGTYDA
ncbi:hypothetical protein [Calidifontibacter terrae]